MDDVFGIGCYVSEFSFVMSECGVRVQVLLPLILIMERLITSDTVKERNEKNKKKKNRGTKIYRGFKHTSYTQKHAHTHSHTHTHTRAYISIYQ